MDRSGQGIGRERRLRPTLAFFRTSAAGVALLLPLAAAPAAALDYPARPITLIVSHNVGGPTDVIGRIVARLLNTTLRQPIVVENRQGAGGTIAGEYVASAKPDGYTLLMGNTAIFAASLARQKQIKYDPQLDFTPISLIGTNANVLVVNPALPALNLTQLVAVARSKPGAITFASAGHGSPSHLAAALFEETAKIDLVHVPYNKPGPALQDVVAGHVQMMFAPAAVVAAHVRQGRLRAIGLATDSRRERLPGVSTLAEQGLPGFDATTWYGLVAPAGTRKEVVDMLHHSTGAALEDAQARRILGGLGIDVVGSSPKEFEAYIARELPKWSTVIKTIGYTN
jgi:tripartite-type tricarboxylate transporter receptor subunit TctC